MSEKRHLKDWFSGWPISFEALACLVSASALAIFAAAPLYSVHLRFKVEAWHWVAAFFGACLLAVAGAWRQAIREGRLPARPDGEPKHAHVSGWTVILLAISAAVILALAGWATMSSNNKAAIDASWGKAVVLALGLAFLLAALAPSWNLAERTASLMRAIDGPVSFIGRRLSVVDSWLVFAVAGSAGATRGRWYIRYPLLFGVLAPCAVLGYWLDPPWGLFPLAWGFIVTVAMSRRWAWVEDDRELAMLNGRFDGAHLRIGFAQDLRDEALLSFMSMFLLVPLALRQTQLSYHLFSLHGVQAESLMNWVGFYGAELAKAAPFVDWAEVYDVGGDKEIEAVDVGAKHTVFAIRVLVDLVFLSALLQAIGIATRNAKQRQLFNDGVLDRLDPFVERAEFRKLVKRGGDGRWEANSEALAKFRVKCDKKYDPIRLAELTDARRYPIIHAAADSLQRLALKDDVSALYGTLIKHAKEKNSAEIAVVLKDIKALSAPINVVVLADVWRKLNWTLAMNEVRSIVIEMIASAPRSTEKVQALFAILDGGGRESVSQHRETALKALEYLFEKQDPAARDLLNRIAKADPAGAIKRLAKALLQQHYGDDRD